MNAYRGRRVGVPAQLPWCKKTDRRTVDAGQSDARSCKPPRLAQRCNWSGATKLFLPDEIIAAGVTELADARGAGTVYGAADA